MVGILLRGTHRTLSYIKQLMRITHRLQLYLFVFNVIPRVDSYPIPRCRNRVIPIKRYIILKIGTQPMAPSCLNIPFGGDGRNRTAVLNVLLYGLRCFNPIDYDNTYRIILSLLVFVHELFP